jgi:Tfp pilus assembly protein PilO
VTVDVARTSAFAALAIVLAGYVVIVRPLEAAIAQRYAALDDARAALVERLARTSMLPALERERQRRAEQVRLLHAGERRAAVVERFLHTVAGVAGRDAVAVESVAAATAAVPTAATATPVFEDLPLDVTVRGRYGDVIRAARDLNAGDALARITLAALANAQARPGERPQLNAAFHVTLLREADDAAPLSARTR